jgi:hypothetical protein
MGSNHSPFARVEERDAGRHAGHPFDSRTRLLRAFAALLAALGRMGMIILLLGAGACPGQTANADHLEPIAPYDPIGFGQSVFNALVGRHSAELWMMCMPIARPVWAVILRPESERPKSRTSADSKPEALSDLDEKQNWVLEVAVAAQPVPDSHKNGKVERKRIEIDEASAKALREAWTAVTRQTRYAEGNAGEFDGVTYQFYSGGQFGETWSPAAGLPAALIELGARLRKCVESPAENRPALLEEAIGMAKDIKTKADNAGGKSAAGGGEAVK